MSDQSFEGSFGGDATKIKNVSSLECSICWYVYEPTKGDDFWQIPAGTPFSKLPDHWTCPTCDGEKNKFMLMDN